MIQIIKNKYNNYELWEKNIPDFPDFKFGEFTLKQLRQIYVQIQHWLVEEYETKNTKS